MKATVNLSLTLVAFRLRCVIFFQTSYIIEHAHKKKYAGTIRLSDTYIGVIYVQ